ncbi:hypothetical protein A4X09_0g2104 [Tilletia walkeri]|uniref:PARP n=1 Tax=Tilletia walkeri TaxID=117179 RepID=A0A8X7ND18_9BASI|nr:hypothetical protein A4X09_0g2104 [Tilletia walkeri]
MSFNTEHFKCLLCSRSLESLAVLCQPCTEISQLASPTFIPLGPEDDSKLYSLIKADFTASWLHHTLTMPEVIAIYAILMDKMSIQLYDSVRGSNQSPMETRLYHGTRVECGFGSSSMVPCDSQTCYLCRIVKEGFRHPMPSGVKAINNGVWDRFGSAIYATPVSSKAADYENMRNRTASNEERLRHIVVVRVATGNQETLHRDDRLHPASTQSVLQEVQR